jgi:hypothetical protein
LESEQSANRVGASDVSSDGKQIDLSARQCAKAPDLMVFSWDPVSKVMVASERQPSKQYSEMMETALGTQIAVSAKQSLKVA